MFSDYYLPNTRSPEMLVAKVIRVTVKKPAKKNR